MEAKNNRDGTQQNRPPVLFEILIQEQFCDLEVSSIVTTLLQANRTCKEAQFVWKFLSDHLGLVTGQAGMISHAERAVLDHSLPDYLLIVGGDKVDPTGWLRRLRAMLCLWWTAVLLSDVATAYIKTLKVSESRLATKWNDVSVLSERGYFPYLRLH
ncbi:hypothetical protein [Epibacterium ulvae]|uniref:hypothetical protein n=1 Tax=Epibacterium ulvae TaxID=1156985 RepID=UPI00249052ED|nr:hypothetical protein [Epibacterium ulvae]